MGEDSASPLVNIGRDASSSAVVSIHIDPFSLSPSALVSLASRGFGGDTLVVDNNDDFSISSFSIKAGDRGAST